MSCNNNRNYAVPAYANVGWQQTTTQTTPQYTTQTTTTAAGVENAVDRLPIVNMPGVQPSVTLPGAVAPSVNLPQVQPPVTLPGNNGSYPDSSGDPLPDTLTHTYYTAGYLRTKIGKLMRVEFLVGNSTTDRVGVLSEVGASYIVLDSLEHQSQIVCDIYSIKFVTIIESQMNAALYGIV